MLGSAGMTPTTTAAVDVKVRIGEVEMTPTGRPMASQSAQGFAYSYEDLAVQPGQTYWYTLEDVSLGGATTLHGPVSATEQAPTAVRLAGDLDAGAAVFFWGRLFSQIPVDFWCLRWYS